VQQLAPCLCDRQGALGEPAPSQGQYRQRVLRDGKRQIPGRIPGPSVCTRQADREVVVGPGPRVWREKIELLADGSRIQARSDIPCPLLQTVVPVSRPPDRQSMNRRTSVIISRPRGTGSPVARSINIAGPCIATTLWYSRNPMMRFARAYPDAACPGPDSWGNDVHNSEGAMTE